MEIRKPRRRGGLTRGELVAVTRHRLEHNLTYEQLGLAIGIGASKAYDLITNSNVVANERTTFKVRRFLASLEPPPLKDNPKRT